MELAHKELIQKPKYVCTDIVARLKLYFATIDNLVAFYKSHEPTNAEVVNMLHTEISNDAEREVLNCLMKYVRGLEKSELCSFPKFVTASDIIITDRIQASFTQITGAARRPISHVDVHLCKFLQTQANFCI